MQRDKVGFFLLIGWTRSRQRECGDSPAPLGPPHDGGDWKRELFRAKQRKHCESERDDRLDGCGIQGVEAHPSGGLAVKARLQRASPRLLTTGREIAA
jgi:hypothetical protein